MKSFSDFVQLKESGLIKYRIEVTGKDPITKRLAKRVIFYTASSPEEAQAHAKEYLSTPVDQGGAGLTNIKSINVSSAEEGPDMVADYGDYISKSGKYAKFGGGEWSKELRRGYSNKDINVILKELVRVTDPSNRVKVNRPKFNKFVGIIQDMWDNHNRAFTDEENADLINILMDRGIVQ